MSRKKKRRKRSARRERADREHSIEREERDRSRREGERDADTAHDPYAGTPMGVPDAPIPDAPMPDAPVPGAPIQRHPKSEGPDRMPQEGDARDRSSLESLYESLDGSRRDALDHISDDDELWASWQATIASDVIQNEIEANGGGVIEDALDRYHRNIVQQGHEPVAFMTGEEANEWYLDLKPNNERPHKPGCVTLEFKPASEDQLCKVTKEGRTMGDFLAREEAIRSKTDREEVLNALGVKEMWSKYENGDRGYDMVSKLKIEGDEATSILSSIVAPMMDDSPEVVRQEGEPVDRSGGEEQFWLTGRFNAKKFEMNGVLEDLLEDSK